MTQTVILALLVSAVGFAAPALAVDPATKELYEKKCKVCHSIGDDAGKLADKGGALDGIGSKHDDAWLRAYLADPKSKKPKAKMPKVKLTEEELDAIVGYLLTL